MKKFMFVMALATTMVACGHKAASVEVETTDSVEVVADTVVVDTVVAE